MDQYVRMKICPLPLAFNPNSEFLKGRKLVSHLFSLASYPHPPDIVIVSKVSEGGSRRGLDSQNLHRRITIQRCTMATAMLAQPFEPTAQVWPKIAPFLMIKGGFDLKWLRLGQGSGWKCLPCQAGTVPADA